MLLFSSIDNGGCSSREARRISLKTMAKKSFLPLSVLLLIALSAALSTPVWAALEDEELVGEVRFDTNSDYPRAAVEGRPWEDVEYENKGRRVVVKNLDLTRESYDITLTPGYDTLGPVTVTVRAKEFRRQRKGRVVYMIVKKKLKFPVVKKKTDDKPTPSPDTKPAPEPDDDL
jgi:hypothetical protein